MKTKKVEDLTEHELDYWTAVATGQNLTDEWDQGDWVMVDGGDGKPPVAWAPTVNWAQAGPLIEETRISIKSASRTWAACHFSRPKSHINSYSPLVAAMILLVRLKLGREVPWLPE